MTFAPLSTGSPRTWEDDVLHQLAAGDLGRVRELLCTADPRHPVARLADVDARMREFDATVVEIQEMRQELRVALPDAEPLHAWADAVLADALILTGDPAGFAFASTAVAPLDDRMFLPTPALFARARLRRALCWVWLLLPSPGSWLEHRARRDGAIMDFNRGGFLEEATFTRASTSGLHAVINAEDVLEAYEILVEARTLHARVSITALALDCLLAWVAFDLRELDASTAAARRVRRHELSGSALALLADLPLALVRVARERARADTQPLERVLARCARVFPAGAHAAYASAAEVLADSDHPASNRFARLSLDHPDQLLPMRGVRELLRQRLALADGEPLSVTDVLVHVRVLADDGRPRVAVRHALRIGLDLARAGRHDDARHLHHEAIELLPPAHRRTRPEHDALDTLTAALTGGSGPAVPPPAHPNGTRATPGRRGHAELLAVRVLTPTLEVALDDKRVSLPPAPAKLLLALILTHPSPLHVEVVDDLLWPTREQGATRRRLNMVVHRLRRALGRSDKAIIRRDELIVLEPADWDVDLFRFREGMAGRPEQQAAALAAVTGNLCSSQFPYDELFVAERHRFSWVWLDCARRLTAADVMRPEQLAAAAANLGLVPDDLVPAGS